MLEVTGVNFSIGSNELTGMKTESGMMQQNLGISRKLWKIFTLVTLKSPGLENQQYGKVRGKKTENWEFSSIIRLRDLVS